MGGGVVRVGRAVLAGVLAVVVLLGCTAEPAADPSSPTAQPGTAGPSASASPVGTASPSPAAPALLRLAFAGDVHFTGRTLRLLDEPESAFGRIAPVLRDADLTLLNLETAVTGRGTPQPKRFHFRAPKSTYAALRAAGVDAASVANNHVLDYGPVGLRDTLDSAAAAKFPVFGAGPNADAAYAPWLTTVRGVRIAVLGMSQVHELSAQWKPTATRPGVAMAFDATRATAAVRAARSQADLVIVFMHWGIEGSSCPSGEMKTFASRMSRAGADIVLGTHAHTLLADGWLGRTYVHYGLGNFLWYGDSKSTDSGVLRLTVQGRTVVRNEFLPGTVSRTGQPVLVTGGARERIQDKIGAARRCTGLAAKRP
ncbi:CapA family protein [Plantactinospora soyae]|uniref:Poly-gamma-glutamate synthesis protein (Capsule biosynthesis protein) n=1 Tax=Plantactinospora soyae TaxID=1544732 RepID=A0A927R072_9ACTN|nr:CapA family protein [Plantactinospora soyae]MBE1489872.1 poly-gamma-glutamate synthesis protein (capsule biosynthesis protein) [Plantactinospora soyae]